MKAEVLFSDCTVTFVHHLCSLETRHQHALAAACHYGEAILIQVVTQCLFPNEKPHCHRFMSGWGTFIASGGSWGSHFSWISLTFGIATVVLLGVLFASVVVIWGLKH